MGIVGAVLLGVATITGISYLAYYLTTKSKQKDARCNKCATLYFGCQFAVSGEDSELSTEILQRTHLVELQGNKLFILVNMYIYIYIINQAKLILNMC